MGHEPRLGQPRDPRHAGGPGRRRHLRQGHRRVVRRATRGGHADSTRRSTVRSARIVGSGLTPRPGPPGTVCEKLITPLFDAVSIYDGPEVFLQQWQRAAPRARLLFAAHFCQSEVCNGGFFQFFDNSTGVLGPEAADGFAAIGQPGCAQVVREALAWFPAPYPRDRELRARCLRLGLPEAAAPHTLFEALDKRFYALLDSEAGGFDAAADRHASAAAGN